MSNKGMLNGRYKHGYFGGLAEYRYGLSPKPKRQEAIFSKAQYETVVTRTVEALSAWRSSPFQHEATCRAGLRQQLCLKGFSWGRSDAEAARIVAAALSRMRAMRPTWIEGQPEHTHAVEDCFHCGMPLDEQQIAMKHRFCSSECAGVVMERNHYRQKTEGAVIYQAAWRITASARHAPRQCANCHGTFRPKAEDANQKFCSLKCAGEAIRTVEDRCCDHCGNTYRPKKNPSELRPDEGRFCSRACTHAHLKQFEDDRDCAYCGTTYVARGKKSTYCSKLCSDQAKRTEHGWVPKRMSSVSIFDHYLTMPINASLPKWLTPERFDDLVAA